MKISALLKCQLRSKMISLIASIGKNNELGKNNDLIFHLKDDLAFFRQKTLNHKIIMGHKTWDSLPHKLEGRENVVISRHNFSGPDLIVHNIKDLIDEYRNSDEEIFVIGGGTIYHQFLPFAQNLYLTEVNASAPDATTFFPEFNPSKYSRNLIKKGKENGLNYSIVKYIKQ